MPPPPAPRLPLPDRARNGPLSILAVLVLCGALAGIDAAGRNKAQPPASGTWPEGAGPLATATLAVAARGILPMPPDTRAAHASTLVAMPANSAASLLACWFAGARESAPDVQIACSWLSRQTGTWQAAQWAVNRHTLGQQLGHGVRRLGNPVAWVDASGRIHLFVVATGLGGWAAGRVAHLRQTEGSTLQKLAFEPVRVLPLSWLWNTSHLVRTAPLPLAGGGMVLPLYFELGIKYSVAARFDAQGGYQGMQRISARGGALQPSVAMASPMQWLAFMRDHQSSRKVQAARSDDAGQTWHDLPALDLPNPDASVAALGLAPGQMVMAHNPSTHGRDTLRLSQSTDGLRWSQLATLATQTSGTDNAEFSYPALAWANGSLWVSYTDQRTRIAWVQLQPASPQRNKGAP